MRGWIRGLVLAGVFAVVGAFAASMWLEVRREPVLEAIERPGHWQGRRIRVEVLNGAGIDGLARQVTERLRRVGFDVVHYGNAERFGRDTSVAIARLDSLEPARRVADAIGLVRVVHEPDRNLYLDVSVILGRDWEPRPEPAEAETAAARRSWWDRAVRAARRLWPR